MTGGDLNASSARPRATTAPAEFSPDNRDGKAAPPRRTSPPCPRPRPPGRSEPSCSAGATPRPVAPAAVARSGSPQGGRCSSRAAPRGPPGGCHGDSTMPARAPMLPLCQDPRGKASPACTVPCFSCHVGERGIISRAEGASIATTEARRANLAGGTRLSPAYRGLE